MTLKEEIEQTIQVIQNEKQCVERNISGCDRNCGNCDLVLPDCTILTGYDKAVSALKDQLGYDQLIREYLGKLYLAGCDGCVAETFCIENGLRSSRFPTEQCEQNIRLYFRDKFNVG